MSPEITWMAASAILTALMFVPYILAYITEVGLVAALTQRVGDDVGQAAWVQRAQWAHRNMIENMVVFGPLAVAVSVAGVSSAWTIGAAAAFFWLRLAHYVIYCFGIPVIRTLLFAGGVLCQIILAIALLAGG